MALSEVSIANSALSKIGAGSITALTDDTPAGRAVNARFGFVRDAELTRNIWNFSVKRTSLAALTAAPDFGYSTAFQLPADCLRVIVVGLSMPGLSLADFRGMVDQAEYAIESGKVLTNDPGPLFLRYVERVTDATRFDAAFAEALAARLAYELCTALSDSSSRKELAYADYQDAVKLAVRANALQLPPQPVADDAWLAVRY